MQDAHDFLVELGDDRLRSLRRREDSIPAGDFVARHAGFAHRRKLRRGRRAFDRRDGKRPQPACLNVRVRLQYCRKQHLDLPGNHVGHRRRAAFVRDVRDGDAGERRKQRARQMTQAASARRTVVERSGLRLGKRYQFLD
jgi:hypothetical protein